MLASTSETASGSSTFFDDDFIDDEDEISGLCIGETFFLDVRLTSDFLQDSMGSVIGAADASGALSARVKYDSFGDVISATGTAASSSNVGGDFRLHGMWLEEISGLYHVRARTYDASTGRFLTRDPVAGVMRRPESMNPYSFVHGNPWIWRDPSGRFGLADAMATVTIVGILSAIAMPSFQSYLMKARVYRTGAALAGTTDSNVAASMLKSDLGQLTTENARRDYFINQLRGMSSNPYWGPIINFALERGYIGSFGFQLQVAPTLPVGVEGSLTIDKSGLTWHLGGGFVLGASVTFLEAGVNAAEWGEMDPDKVVLHASELLGTGLGQHCDAMWQMSNAAGQVGCAVGLQAGAAVSLTVGKTGTIAFE